MQVLWKKGFFKNPRWQLKRVFSIPAAILDLLKNFFRQNLRHSKTK
jgi:hypothetical protein